jgi:hypothetical protein
MAKHHFLPGGTLAQRKEHVKFLQEKFHISQVDVGSMPENIFSKFESKLRNEAEPHLRQCGEVFMEHTERDDAGRRMRTYEGDIRSAFAEFLPKKMAVRINGNLASENQQRREKIAYGKFLQGHRNEG